MRRRRINFSLISGQGNADRRIRGDGANSQPKFADLSGHRGKTCQFIAGEDHYMCGEPGFPYCEAHWAVTHIKPDPVETVISERELRLTRPKRPKTPMGGKWS